MTTQNDAIRRHLEAGYALTPIEAFQQMGCLRLAARIEELRDAGLPIETVIERKGRKSWASYRLRRPPATQLGLFA